MAICRIFLTTYRRHATLPRAIDSLLKQTVTDWICEVHNDDPSDPFPRQLVEEIGDPRIKIVDHAKNFGATYTFNLPFQPVQEEFVSILEDDNWWEPDFLEVMIKTMEGHGLNLPRQSGVSLKQHHHSYSIGEIRIKFLPLSTQMGRCWCDRNPRLIIRFLSKRLLTVPK
jgi:glycosyltransferase involved in cell wall biosynthesis